MARTTSFTLGEELDQYVRQKVATGAYASASDLMRTLLERDREDDAKRAFLDAALAEARSEPLDPRSHEEIWDELFREFGIEP